MLETMKVSQKGGLSISQFFIRHSPELNTDMEIDTIGANFMGFQNGKFTFNEFFFDRMFEQLWISDLRQLALMQEVFS